MFIIGKPDSGKSHLLYEIVKNEELYKKAFNNIIFITPVSEIGDIKIKECKYSMDSLDLKKLEGFVSDINVEIRKKYPTRGDIDKKYG